MKSYNHLYEICISEANRREAIKQAKHSKRIRKIIKKRHLSDDVLLVESYNWITNYSNAEHIPIQIYDGISRKERTIIVPTLEELIVQHCIVNALKPMFWHGMYEHSYASLPDRGAHKGKKVIEKWITHDSKNVKYILKIDIHHFFQSISHDILKAKLTKKIHDEKMLDLLFKIIDVTDVGLPLGFYTSQWLSNWYLQSLDHYIKEQLGAVHYIRYMDDMVIFGNNKKVLHRMRQAINDYLRSELGLELKENWQVFRFSYGSNKGRDLDFMGFRFYRNRTVLRRSIMLKATRKAKRISVKEKPTIYDLRQMLSYLGWIDCTDTYLMYLYWIKPYVNFQAMKRKISKYDKHNEQRIYSKLTRLYT
jgi:RNA-directed DNA polymerase